MPRHKLFVYATGKTRPWVEAGTFVVGPGESLYDAQGTFDALEIDADLLPAEEYHVTQENAFFIQDDVLGEYRMGQVRMTMLDLYQAIDAQINDRNLLPAREDFIYIDENAPLYVIHRTMVPVLAHDLFVYGGAEAGWRKAPVMYSDTEATSILAALKAHPRLWSFLARELDIGTGKKLSTLDKELHEKFILSEVGCYVRVCEAPLMLGNAVDLTARLAEQILGVTLLDQAGEKLGEVGVEGAITMTAALNPPIYLIAHALEKELEAAVLHEDDLVEERDPGAQLSKDIGSVITTCKLMSGPPLLVAPDYGQRMHFCTYYSYLFNHPFVHDLWEAWVGTAPKDCTAPVTSSKNFVVMPKTVSYMDFFNLGFVQDSFKPCWGRGSGKWEPVLLQCPHKYAPPKCPFEVTTVRLSGDKTNGLNYGGNFLVSFPVAQETEAIASAVTAMGACGPVVAAHPVSPFGKIVVGDCRRGFHSTCLDDDVRSGLMARGLGAQPWLPIDVSWLDVGHVDEIISFVPTRSGNQMVMVSTSAMRGLLEELAALPHRLLRKFHVGKWERVKDNGKPATRKEVGPEGFVNYKELSLGELLGNTLRLANARLQAQKLDPIRTRLQKGLALLESSIVELPVYFNLTGSREMAKASSTTVNIVNMQLVNGHVCISRPCGPRVSASEASTILSKLLGKRITVASPKGFWHWAFPGEEPRRLALYYLPYYLAYVKETTYTAEMEKERRRAIDEGAHDSCSLVTLCDEFLDGLAGCGENFISDDFFTDLIAKKWFRVWISMPLVDIVEEYVKAVLDLPPAMIHFVEGWEYHIRGGDVHCGTNAWSLAPEAWDEPMEALLRREEGGKIYVYEP